MANRGSDSIGSNKRHGLSKGDVLMGNKPIRNHPEQANTPHGRVKTVGDSKGTGADLVAQVKAGNNRDETSTGMKFRIGENQAKRFSHDAEPE